LKKKGEHVAKASWSTSTTVDCSKGHLTKMLHVVAATSV
jgi:hypothetical protein